MKEQVEQEKRQQKKNEKEAASGVQRPVEVVEGAEEGEDETIFTISCATTMGRHLSGHMPLTHDLREPCIVGVNAFKRWSKPGALPRNALGLFRVSFDSRSTDLGT